MKIYMIGIKGSGMSALANVLYDLGNVVKGVDYPKKFFTEDLLREGIIVESFQNYHLEEDAFYIIGNAFKTHPLTREIRDLEYPFSFYPEFIEEHFTMPKIGISGSHGKTTTTLFTSLLADSKMNVIIGDGTGIGNKDAKYLLLEACEYQNNFLKYHYQCLVILNIDYDHPDFFKSSNEYQYAFQKAALNADTLIINNDMPECRKIIHKNKITFGFEEGARVRMSVPKEGFLNLFMDGKSYSFKLPFLGNSFLYDFTAAFLVNYLFCHNLDSVIKNVPNLRLPHRRMTEYKVKDNMVVDDYAHHPTEIKALLSSLRLKYPKEHMVAIFQPHTLSRTEAFYKEFITALHGADEVYLMPIFSSVRENDSLDKDFLLKGDPFFQSYFEKKEKLFRNRKHTIFVFMGAGDIGDEALLAIKILEMEEKMIS